MIVLNAEVYEQHSNISVLFVQMSEGLNFALSDAEGLIFSVKNTQMSNGYFNLPKTLFSYSHPPQYSNSTLLLLWLHLLLLLLLLFYFL